MSDEFCEKVFDGTVRIGGVLLRCVYHGFRRCTSNAYWLIYPIAFIGTLSLHQSQRGDYLVWLWNRTSWEWVHRHISYAYHEMPALNHFLWLFGFTYATFLVLVGLFEVGRMTRYQNRLDMIGLKNGLGETPKVKNIERTEHGLRLLVHSPGIGLSAFKNQEDALSMAMGESVESIDGIPHSSKLTISITRKQMPTHSPYEELIQTRRPAYSFVVGASHNGIVTQRISDLPHMLMVGTTGGGKSMFFRQVILGLLETSSALQVVLLDLKRGVEMNRFATLPNVKVAKEESEAVALLRKICDEMDRRFRYLSEHKYRFIEPERDKVDRLVVGVDEASVLYTLSSRKSAQNDWANTARDLTQRIAKLGRAAAIHLILATQKVANSTIDTHIQENLEGRMCFRTNTLQGSIAVLGNKMAFELPDTPGRAIWNHGNTFITLQAPYLSEAVMEERMLVLEAEYALGQKVIYQKDLFGEDSGRHYDFLHQMTHG